jgi:pimeloyl-ACP methyl ester carboxylesterase
MFSSVDSQIVKFAASSERIARDQQAMLDRLEPATASRPTPTVAVVAWLGYPSPGLTNVETLDLAKRAESALTSSVRGLRAIRGEHQPFVSVMAHSYGSTGAMLALQSGGLSVDALAIVGSPGSPAASASDLSVTGGNIWVGQAASMDPVPSTGLFGSRPTESSYGAHLFGTAGAIDPLTGKRLSGAVGHNDYFLAGTESLRNIELIGIDRADLVLPPGT